MRKFVIFLVTTAFLVFLASCTSVVSSQPEENTTSETGAVRVYLTDRPVSDVDSLYVDINGASYHYETDSTEVTEEVDIATSLDLLSLAGTEMRLFDMEIPDGATLVYIALTIEDATAVVKGEEVGVTVLGKNTKILIHQRVSSDTSVILDFDVSRSLIEAGNPARPTYMLKPVLKSYTVKGSERRYTVEGMLEDGEGNPIARAVVVLTPEDESTVTRVTLSRREGDFHIRHVEEGNYKLFIFKDFEIPENEQSILDILSASDYSTEVQVDGDVDLGTIVISD